MNFKNGKLIDLINAIYLKRNFNSNYKCKKLRFIYKLKKNDKTLIIAQGRNDEIPPFKRIEAFQKGRYQGLR